MTDNVISLTDLIESRLKKQQEIEYYQETLEDIAQMNMKKLKFRQERNKIEGEGDNR